MKTGARAIPQGSEHGVPTLRDAQRSPVPACNREKLPVDAALALIVRHIDPFPVKRMAVDADALGAILAGDARALVDTPRNDCSAMDGFALRSRDSAEADTHHPVRLKLAADIAAETSAGLLEAGYAAPISTGAAVPVGADTILVRERGEVGADGTLIVHRPVPPGLNIRRRGEDAARGERVVTNGTRILAEHIGALLAYGVAAVDVRRLPRLRLLPTGSELRSPGQPGTGDRYDSNGPMLLAACRDLQLPASLAAPVADDLATILGAMESAEEDLLVTIGGASGGQHDHVRQCIEAIGGRIHFHGLAMRPGKPLLFATLPDGRAFFGLPGNPVAALVGFRFFVLAAVRRMLGLGPECGEPVSQLAEGRPGVSLFLRGTTDQGGNLRAADDQRSHVMRSLIAADSWLRVDRVPGGTEVHRYPLRGRLE